MIPYTPTQNIISSHDILHLQVAVLGPLLLARDVDASLTTTTPTTPIPIPTPLCVHGERGNEIVNGNVSVNGKNDNSNTNDDQEVSFLVEAGLGEEKKTGVTDQNQNHKLSTTMAATATLTDTPTPPVSPSPPSPPPSSSSSSTRPREPVPITDSSLLALALAHDVTVDSNGEFDLTYQEMLSHPSIWLLTLFFTTILTPGWGIKVYYVT